MSGRVKHPVTKVLAAKAYAKSGCVNHEEFATFLGGVGVRTIRRWLAGEGPAGPLDQLVLAEVGDGWRPKRSGPRP